MRFSFLNFILNHLSFRHFSSEKKRENKTDGVRETSYQDDVTHHGQQKQMSPARLPSGETTTNRTFTTRTSKWKNKTKKSNHTAKEFLLCVCCPHFSIVKHNPSRHFVIIVEKKKRKWMFSLFFGLVVSDWPSSWRNQKKNTHGFIGTPTFAWRTTCGSLIYGNTDVHLKHWNEEKLNR